MALEGGSFEYPFPLYVGKVLFLPREPGTTISARPLWVCNLGPMTLDDFTSSSEDGLGG